MKYLLFFLLFSSCQFDSKPNFNTIKSTPMNPQTIRLTVGAIYSLNDNTNYTLKQYSQDEVVLKYLRDLKVEEKKMPMNVFLSSNPQNRGKI